MTTDSRASDDHVVLLGVFGTESPRVMACLRQVYRVTSERRSSRDNSVTDRLLGGKNSFFKTTLSSQMNNASFLITAPRSYF